MTQNHLDTCINQSMQKGITLRLCNTAQLPRTVWLPYILLPPPFGLLHFSFLCSLNSNRITESCRSWWDQAAFLQWHLTQPCSAGSLTTDSHVPNTSPGPETCSFSQNPIFAVATRGICAVSSYSSPLSQTGRKAKASLPEYWFKNFIFLFVFFFCLFVVFLSLIIQCALFIT